MPNNIIHLPGNINASQILYEDNSNIKNKIDNIQTSIVEANDNFNEELEKVETKINNKTTELNQKISNIVNVSYTETQAITHSSTNTNTIYFSTDTNSIIINGEIYGRGQHLNGVFKLIPSDKTIGSTGYDNTNVIYIQPDGTNFKLYYYSVNNTWESIENIAFDTNIDASDMSYDISNTPDLGSGDVQSAIEALDGKVEEVKEDVVRTGYLIASWEDDKILTDTTYTVGSTVGDWAANARYGCRGVRLNVKEGDKVLLDTYSPALFGLIFTDENRVVKALYDDRRFDGVWTAPVNGYCYIQDVLYRDCYHYSSAHGHLAYMAHDARKRVAKGGDWYNELAPRVLRDVIPNVENFNAPKGTPQLFARLDGVHHSSTSSEQALATAFNALSRGKMQYKLAAFHVVVHHSSVARGAFTDIYQNGLTTTLKIATLDFSDIANEDIEGWVISVKHCTSDKIDGGFGVYSNISTAGMLNVTFDKVFVHTSSDFGELYALAQKIINGEVEVDNFYGVKEKEVDLVKNAIALKSISELGYNILDYGATLPIDEEGYKYAKELYKKYKDNPPSGQNWGKTNSPFYNNDNTLKLVYLPKIDFSHFKTNGSDYLASAFYGCANLVCVGDIILPEECTGAYNNYLNSTFTNCYSLKQIGNISVPMNKICGAYHMCHNCYALEKVGKITSNGIASSSIFQNCYSLERIEEISLKKTPYFAANASPFLNCISLRFMLIKEFGTITGSGTYVLSGATSWGIPNDKHPDARQSLVDSLLTYSYDRVNDPDELGTTDTTCTINLSVNSYNQLTTEEIDAITAKGYTLTHP